METPFKSLFNFEIKYENKNQGNDRHFQFTAKLETNYKAKVIANFVELWLPLPPDAQNVKITADLGKGKYQSEENVVAWKLKDLTGKK